MRSKRSGIRPKLVLFSFLFLLQGITNLHDASAVVYVHYSPITLWWEAAPGAVDHYNVYLSANLQPFVLNGQTPSNSLSLPVQDGTQVVVQIEAESPNGITGPLSDPSEDVAIYLNGSAEDTDGDGMPDAWEVTYGLNPYNPADAPGDPDSDGLSNSAEFLAGTIPTNPDTDNDGILDGADVQGGENPPSPPDPVPGPDCPAEVADEGIFPMPEAGAYGKISRGDLTHVNDVKYSFPPGPGDVTIAYEVWDVDSSDEVEISVNGLPVGFAPRTENNSWGPLQTIFIPAYYVDDSCTNILTFRNTRNPPKTTWWGVRNVHLTDPDPPNPLPDSGAYGKIMDGDQTHVVSFTCSFPPSPGDVNLLYEVWDVDFSDEVEISVNGHPIGFAPKTEDESWGPPRTILVPDSYVNDSSTNILTFRNTRNPPKRYWWGVRNVSLL